MSKKICFSLKSFCLLMAFFTTVLTNAESNVTYPVIPGDPEYFRMIGSVKLDDIVRDADGNIFEMTWSEAQKYCSDPNGQRTRLPTIRELALAMFADGVRETSFPDIPETDPRVNKEQDQMWAEGYFPVRKVVSGDIFVEFYFDNSAYQRIGAIGPIIWTSSITPAMKSTVYYLRESGKVIGVANRTPITRGAVRCLTRN